MRIAYDAATPEPNGVPGTDTVLLYIGGDATHLWTDIEIAAQPERFRLPVFVRSFGGVDPNQDAIAALNWLKSHSVPLGTSVVIDLETLIDPPYVNGFGNDLRAGGYFVLPYGSRATIFDNPKLDGYFTAHPDALGIDAGAVATQYGYYGSYDVSWIDDSVRLWDTQPPPPEEIPMFAVVPDPVAVAQGHKDAAWWIKSDGSVYAYDDARFLGSPLPGLWNWATIGTLVAFEAWEGDGTDVNGNGYRWVLERHDGTGFAFYNVPGVGLKASGPATLHPSSTAL